MQEINLLTCWFYGVNNPAFNLLMKELKIKKCFYIRTEENEEVKNDLIIPLDINNPLSYYSDASIEYELDDYIVNLMKPYEQICLDIINRWRRSYINSSNYRDIKELYYIFLRYWNDYILKHRINLMIINVMPHVVDEFVPYAICKARSIPTIIQGVMPFTKGEKINFILRPSHDLFDLNISARYNTLKEEYNREGKEVQLIPEMRRYFEQYDLNACIDKKVVFFNEKSSIVNRIAFYKKHAEKYLKRKEIKILSNKILYLIKIKYETARFLKKVERLEENVDEQQDFLLFCLHLQPEATTTPAGGIYSDQLMAIRLISENLPDGLYLYVKEHPAYWIQKNRLESIYESRNEQFYKQIKKLRNVRLIDHRISSGELLNDCLAVVTVTGTVGFEAIFRGIPVILFGATFYEEYPTVYRIRTAEDCKRAIAAVQSDKRVMDYRELEIFLAAVQKYVVPLGMMHEKNFIDNGSPVINDADKILLAKKIIEFYREYYCT